MLAQIENERRNNIAKFFALMGAAIEGFPDVVRDMLDQGVDVNVKAVDMGLEGFDRNVEKATIKDSDTPLLVTVKHSGNLDIVQLLLDRGADVMAKDEDGKTPRMIAMEKGYLDIAKLFETLEPPCPPTALGQ